MRRVLRGCGATFVALAVSGLGPAHAANLVWEFNHDEESAFVGVVDSAAKEESEADYPFFMSCVSTGDAMTVVSSVDAKALGASIAKGDVPTFSYVLDGEAQEDSGGVISDLRFDEMNGVWQYLVNGVDYDLLLTATRTIGIKGVGVEFELPQKDMMASLQQFKDACDALVSGGDGGPGDDSAGAQPATK